MGCQSGCNKYGDYTCPRALHDKALQRQLYKAKHAIQLQ